MTDKERRQSLNWFEKEVAALKRDSKRLERKILKLAKQYRIAV